jgi:hypothetical protein
VQERLPHPGDSPLSDLAIAVQQRELLQKKRPKQLGAGWRITILLMRIWAGLWLGGGLIATIVTLITLGLGGPFFEKHSTATNVNYSGWGIGAGIAVFCFILAAIQNALATAIRKRRMK